jgi:hypothetical protein
MPEAVVDGLEVINVEQDQCERTAVVLGACNLFTKSPLEVPRVVQTGEAVEVVCRETRAHWPAGDVNGRCGSRQSP